ncbi:MAG TPA: hypothetical protein VFA98_08235 [Thermoanaerobaculia bacterium]|jgi:hypothetical protein|nr:hypothetical protein [Thermoanaerobaculia bacterium]
MAGRDLVDHSKSSWESLLPVAGIATFVLVQRAKLNPIPKAALAGVCAGFTYGTLQKNTPKLGGALGGVMAAYAALKALEESGPEAYATGVARGRRSRGRGGSRSKCPSNLYDASGRCFQSPGSPSPAAGSNFDDKGGKFCQCWANVDVFGNIQDHSSCYPSKDDASNKANGFPGRPLDNQGGDYYSGVPCPAGGVKTAPPATATGLSWEEMEQATPDLAAAKRAAQIAWRSYMSMPGIGQAGYKLTKSTFFPEDTW